MTVYPSAHRDKGFNRENMKKHKYVSHHFQFSCVCLCVFIICYFFPSLYTTFHLCTVKLIIFKFIDSVESRSIFFYLIFHLAHYHIFVLLVLSPSTIHHPPFTIHHHSLYYYCLDIQTLSTQHQQQPAHKREHRTISHSRNIQSHLSSCLHS